MLKLRVSEFGSHETLIHNELQLQQKIGKIFQSFIKKMDFQLGQYRAQYFFFLNKDIRPITDSFFQQQCLNQNVLDRGQASRQIYGTFLDFFLQCQSQGRMDNKNPIKKDVLVKQSSQLNQKAYVQLQQQSSIEFGVQFPTITKTQEQKSKNELENEDRQSKSMNSISNNFQPQFKLSIPKSVNHNFQKHTVVTIKKLVPNINMAFGTGQVQLIANQMWSIFISSGIKSKRILVILFGRANLKDQRYKDLLKNCFFGQLCNYDEQAVRSAQNLLRERVVLSLEEGRVRENIERNRHIQLREQFYAYFMQFVQNLKRAPLVKFRINSSTSKNIAQRIKTTPFLDTKSGRIKRNSSKNYRH